MPPRSPSSGSFPKDTYADYDGDGHQDVFYSYGSSNAPDLSEGAFRLGRGDGTFGSETVKSFEITDRPSYFTAADVTGDGVDELFVRGLVGLDYPYVRAYTLVCTDPED